MVTGLWEVTLKKIQFVQFKCSTTKILFSMLLYESAKYNYSSYYVPFVFRFSEIRFAGRNAVVKLLVAAPMPGGYFTHHKV